MKKKYEVNVPLVCKSCSSRDINMSDDRTFAKCNSCQREYPGGYDELVKLNQSRINAEVRKMKNEFAEDARKQLEKAMKDAFKGSKFLKLK